MYSLFPIKLEGSVEIVCLGDRTRALSIHLGHTKKIPSILKLYTANEK